jgi:5-methylcytosine-specific restriction enzyme subunit McrC
MKAPDVEQVVESDAPLAYDKVPLRNVWLLFLYASDLAQFRDKFEAEIEESPDFKFLVARLLCYATEKRLRRNLSFGYQRRHDVLRRVRGRIDIFESISRDLFRRGEDACRFDEMTLDTPRNRLVLGALQRLSSWLEDAALAHRCRSLVHALGRAGVSSVMPSRIEIAADQIARHEGDDRLMISLAKAVFDLVLPTEQEGTRTLLKSQRDETEFRKLFEKAVGNFFVAELKREDGWRVFPGKKFSWPVVSGSPGISSYMPMMKTDIILENIREERRVIIDTKFTDILTTSQYGGERFKTGHIYQLYSYLRSQERSDDPMSLCSDGILLYPSIGVEIDESALIQDHRVRFVTIDLARPSAEVVENLRAIPTLSTLLSSSVPKRAY